MIKGCRLLRKREFNKRRRQLKAERNLNKDKAK